MPTPLAKSKDTVKYSQTSEQSSTLEGRYCSLDNPRYATRHGHCQVLREPHDVEIGGSNSLLLRKQWTWKLWIQTARPWHLSDKRFPQPEGILPPSSSQWRLCLGLRGLHGRDQADRNIMTTNQLTPTKLTSQFQKHITEQSQNQAMNARDGKNMPVSWSLPFSRCFIVPTASFVMSENSKLIQSEKPDMSQQHWITAFPPFISVGKGHFL